MIKLTFYIIRCNMNNNIFTIAQRLQEVKEKTKMAKLLYNFHTHYTNINLVCCLKLITCRDKSEKTFHNRPNSTETEFRKQDLKFYLKKKNQQKFTLSASFCCFSSSLRRLSSSFCFIFSSFLRALHKDIIKHNSKEETKPR